MSGIDSVFPKSDGAPAARETVAGPANVARCSQEATAFAFASFSTEHERTEDNRHHWLRQLGALCRTPVRSESDVTPSGHGPADPALSLVVERNTAESFLAEATVPGVEVHADRDVTWVVHPCHVWRNAGVMVRFSDKTAADRLDRMVDRYRRHRRGMGLWISPAATPPDLTAFLQSRRMRCRKHFPAMVRALSDPAIAIRVPSGLIIRHVRDVDEFASTPHPAIGLPTTTLRKAALTRLGALVAAPSPQIMPFVAYLKGEPVGASELFIGSDRVAGLIGLSVLEEYRGRGIGAVLLEHTCQEASSRGATIMTLIATSDGERLYTRRGFVEVGRFGYWYRSFQRKLET